MARPRYAAPPLDLVGVFASAAGEIASRLPSGDTGARVPACPGWSVYDLVVHLGNVHAWAATVLETGGPAPAQDDAPPSRRPKAVAEWYLGKAGDLLAVLRAADPAAQCWTFSPTDRTGAFWRRRQAHETVVHLVDLCQASGGTTDLDPVASADGVAEVLEVFLPRMHRRSPVDLRAALLLNAADTGDTWLLTPASAGSEAPPLVRLVRDTDLVDEVTDLVTAPAADLMLLLWRRLPPDAPSVTLDGDRERLLAFLGSRLTP